MTNICDKGEKTSFDLRGLIQRIAWKRTIIILIILQGCILNAQNTASISLNGEWKLSYGIYDRNTPVTPDDLKDKNWPVISGKVPGNVELDLVHAGIPRFSRALCKEKKNSGSSRRQM